VPVNRLHRLRESFRSLSLTPAPAAIRVNGRVLDPLSFSQPHSRPPVIPIEEDHARLFEGVLFSQVVPMYIAAFSARAVAR